MDCSSASKGILSSSDNNFYQYESVSDKLIVESLDIEDQSFETIQTRKGYAFKYAAIALVALTVFLGYRSDLILSSSEPAEFKSNHSNHKNKDKSPSSSTSAISHFSPSFDHVDPCEGEASMRGQCCTDPGYPVLGGVDLVGIKNNGQAGLGTSRYAVKVQRGPSTYEFWFTSEQNKQMFLNDEVGYIPEFGGFDFSKYCGTPGSTMSDLISNTVGLSNVQSYGGSLFFLASPHEDSSAAFGNLPACQQRWASFFGSSNSGVFNTQCYSFEGDAQAKIVKSATKAAKMQAMPAAAPQPAAHAPQAVSPVSQAPPAAAVPKSAHVPGGAGMPHVPKGTAAAVAPVTSTGGSMPKPIVSAVPDGGSAAGGVAAAPVPADQKKAVSESPGGKYKPPPVVGYPANRLPVAQPYNGPTVPVVPYAERKGLPSASSSTPPAIQMSPQANQPAKVTADLPKVAQGSPNLIMASGPPPVPGAAAAPAPAPAAAAPAAVAPAPIPQQVSALGAAPSGFHPKSTLTSPGASAPLGAGKNFLMHAHSPTSDAPAAT